MAKYQVTQKALVGGKNVSSTFVLHGDADDLSALGAHLAGGYEVKEINESLSDMSSADTNNATTNPVNQINLRGPKGQFVSIKPYSGVIHFKNTSTVDDIANALKTTKPFELLPTETPTGITVKRSEYYAGSETTAP
ncbi:MAG: hypothetical protein ACQERD_00995 [Campylobacterota bacterium]